MQDRPENCRGFSRPVRNPNIAPACISEEPGRGLICDNCPKEIRKLVEKNRKEHPRPKYWFILQQVDEDGGRPYMDKRDLDSWGGVPIPVSEGSLRPAYEDPLVEFASQDATVTIDFRTIVEAVRETGKDITFPPNFVSITLPQRLGRLVSNVMNFESLQDYIDYKNPFGDDLPRKE